MAPSSFLIAVLMCTAATLAFPQNPEQIPLEFGPSQDGPEPTQLDLIQPAEQPEAQVPALNGGRADDDDDDADDDKTPSFNPFGRKGVPHANVFFPIMLGGGSSRRSASPGHPRGPTAIANSFSTGRRGVATSHAIVYAGRPTNADQELKAAQP